MLAEGEAEGEVERALELIAGLPSWSATRTRDGRRQLTDADARACIETARALRALEPESGRTATQLTLDRAHGAGIHPADIFSAGRYVLDRVLFAALAKVPQAEARDFADHARPIQSSCPPAPFANLLHPVVLDADGAVIDLEPASHRPVVVGPYAAVEAFDHLRAADGFRADIRCAGPPKSAPGE